ncbi:SMP-30/gluconolactonase/LRE family protein [Desulfonema ishimotonii]|nr:SMP-30/gluconolactonase/LRE family protein [Desulfonema ishimotonii]
MKQNIPIDLLKTILVFVMIALLHIPAAFAEDIYKFERMWPALQQPWYFSSPAGMAMDSKGFIYVADASTHCVKKFTSDGHFVSQIGSFGGVYTPLKIAIDQNGKYLYTVDPRDNAVRRFTLEGSSAGKWGGVSSAEEGEFTNPKGVHITADGIVYVADSTNNRVQKFDSSGKFLKEFGTDVLISPIDMAADEYGNVYVLDYYGHCIHKFDDDGNPVKQIVTKGDLLCPSDIVIYDRHIYVADTGNNAIKKFTLDGIPVTIWEKDNVRFSHPKGLAIHTDEGGTAWLYVTDTGNHCIKRFDLRNPTDTEQQWKRGERGRTDEGDFEYPSDIAIDHNTGLVYIADTNNYRIQVLDPNGETGTFEIWTGITDDTQGKFYQPKAVAIDGEDCLYVADDLNHRIQKFDANGKFVKQWGDSSPGGFSGKAGFLKRLKGIAVDKERGHIYVASANTRSIVKYDLEGTYLTEWKISESSQEKPNCVAVDSAGNLYVGTETSEEAEDNQYHRIYKYRMNPDDPAAQPQSHQIWGDIKGSALGEFTEPRAIAVDNDGKIYIADTGNNRIQILSAANGAYSDQFGKPDDTGPSSISQYFSLIEELHPDYDTEVADQYLSHDARDGKVHTPMGILLDNDGNIYVSDTGNHRIQKFDSEKRFISKWGGTGTNPGEFYDVNGVAMDSSGNIYAADFKNHRIQKFDSQGKFVKEWGSNGTGNGQFDFPNAIAVDSQGKYLYVSDFGNNRIQIFTSEGQYVGQWGEFGCTDPKCNLMSGDFEARGKFFLPAGIAIENDGNVYVADYFNYRIQKFKAFDSKNPDGEVLEIINCPITPESGKPFLPSDIAIHNNILYVVEPDFHHIWGYDLDSKTWHMWGKKGREDGEFLGPAAIATDDQGYIYVSDTGNHRVQKFAPPDFSIKSLVFKGKIGSSGSSPGQFSYPGHLCVSKDGSKVYVADTMNHRVQAFSKWLDSEITMKAIVIAGGGPYIGNAIWNQTQMNANLAYSALIYQGFTKETICYLSHGDTEIDENGNEVVKTDLDGNGEFDDIDRLATNKNIEWAIKEWASDADELIIYFVDHGDKGVMKVGPNEPLEAVMLDSWLDAVQGDPEDENQREIPGTITFVYDACHSGSFLPILSPPEGKKRILITSAAATQKASFVSQGSVSFSSYFWTHVFNGLTIGEAFEQTREAVTYTAINQSALLDDNGDAEYNDLDGALADSSYIGNATEIQGEAPTIESVSPPQNIPESQKNAELSATGVYDDNAVIRVWAVIRPPDYSPDSDLGNPVYDMPSFELLPVAGQPGSYSGIYEGFDIPGRYYISVYARDNIGNTSLPMQTVVTVGASRKSRAVILAGEVNENIVSAIKKAADTAYNALLFQGFEADRIYFMAPWTECTGWDAGAFSDNLGGYALTDRFLEDDTDDLVVYIVGEGRDREFVINETEIISARELNGYLENAQSLVSGRMTVVYDACQSGSFLPELIPAENRERVVITGSAANQAAHFIGERNISFSKYFWTAIFNGAQVINAFDTAISSFSSELNPGDQCIKQNPRMDADGDGRFISKYDRKLAEYYIGIGIMQAGDMPVIGQVVGEQILTEETKAYVWAENIASAAPIERVWAVIHACKIKHPPEIPISDPPVVELKDDGNGRYEAAYSFALEGKYDILIYTQDSEGNISLPLSTTVIQGMSCEEKFIVNASAGENGLISPSGDIVVKSGADQPFTIIPFSGYHVNNVFVDNEPVDRVTEYTFQSVNMSHEIHVEFERNDADTDADGMPALWEVENGLDPAADDADEDADGDGFSNVREYKAETDPNDAASGPKHLTNILYLNSTRGSGTMRYGDYRKAIADALANYQNSAVFNIDSVQEHQAGDLAARLRGKPDGFYNQIWFDTTLWDKPVLSDDDLAALSDWAAYHQPEFILDSTFFYRNKKDNTLSSAATAITVNEALWLRDAGGGIFIGTDHNTFARTADQILAHFGFGKTSFTGNYEISDDGYFFGKLLVGPETVGDTFFTEHFEGLTTARIPVGVHLLNENGGNRQIEIREVLFSMSSEYLNNTPPQHIPHIGASFDTGNMLIPIATPSADDITDTDQDGLPDSLEEEKGTDPTQADTDGDGLTDYSEILKNTDPTQNDTDGDTMPDGWEVQYGLEPLVNDAWEDADGDGVENIEEYSAGTDPSDPQDFPEPDCEVVHMDMNTWGQEGPAGNGNWNVTEQGSAVFQSINGKPTFFVAPESFINKTIIGRFGVMEGKDNDWMGFVFGYQDENNFYLFSWKQAAQKGAIPGFVLAHVTGGADCIPWACQYSNNSGYEVLAVDKGIGWQDYTIYDFVLTYTENKIRITLAGGQFGRGRVIFDIDGEFPEGRFGFYNYSQRRVTYGGLIQKCVSQAEENTPDSNPDADNDGMPDSWEILHGLDPNVNDAKQDADNDSYTNLQEYDKDTDPNNPDSRPYPYEFEAGTFTVEEDGQVRVDYLFDGGYYEGELGMFSLSGMDMEPGSPEFVEEAVSRVMSRSDSGHIIVRDKIEGARFSGHLGSSTEPEFNKGPYRGIKVFEMNPWDKFALVLIPDGTFEEYRQGQTEPPIFSLATANPDDDLLYGQIAGISSKFSTFLNALAFEDIAANHSDRDYNDVVVQLRGVTIHAPTIDGLIAEGYMEPEDDWRTGQTPLENHIVVPRPDPSTLWLTVTLKSPADLLVYAPEEESAKEDNPRFIGKDGGTIPGATFEWDANGHQVVTLPTLSDGDYTIVLRAIGDGGLCHLEVRGYQGDRELGFHETELTIEPHRVLKSVLSAPAFIENQEITFSQPETPKAQDGTELHFDFDGDGDIDDADIERISAMWGAEEGDPEYDAFYDLDDDGRIGLYDIMSVANSWYVIQGVLQH